MRAIILSAGQGRRLMPWTALQPKCLLEVRDNESVLGHQLRTLAACGVTQASVVTGFEAGRVEHFLRWSPIPGIRVETIHNPFFDVADNLVSCWMARERMAEPFLLLNGDTLFEPAVLRRLLASPSTPIVVSIDRKPTYDADDMKVCVDGTRLLAIGKELDLHTVNGESIGLLLFREDGPDLYRRELENAVHAERSLQAWHLDVVNRLAPETRIETLSVEGLRWWEIDTPEDLAAVRAALCAIRQAA